MSGFKDFVQSDLSTFFNSSEFATSHAINGKEILCVIDESLIHERRLQSRAEAVDGVFSKEIILYVKTVDIECEPLRGEEFRLDGSLFFVEEVGHIGGVLEITLVANES
ncbi:hypothetical protein [Aminobacterium colombiense]|uniref:Uncharacterized protein n=1 Tax=Aminobacterium colombiense (strain DSM 12261 / ALA-1) TaxID=572547 RepID=D5EFB0_AMICL|nr:hypothetical protein [Aminobacterium colombiense]ADE57242.1 conserved hypothetical protein [Aminobacterium colombiense DSM 12261]